MKTPPQINGRHAALAIAVLGLIMSAVLMTSCSTLARTDGEQNNAPSTAQVRDGFGLDVDSQEPRTSLFANWDAFIDPEKQPVVYEWSAGTKPGSTDILEWQPVGGAQQAEARNLDLPTGITLHINVRADDLGGRKSVVASSDGIVIGESVHHHPRREMQRRHRFRQAISFASIATASPGRLIALPGAVATSTETGGCSVRSPSRASILQAAKTVRACATAR